MISLAGFVTALTAAAASVTALPAPDERAAAAFQAGLEARAARLEARNSGLVPSSGTHEGYYYGWWTDRHQLLTDTQWSLLPGGGFGVEWNEDLVFSLGLGWNSSQPHRREIEYTSNLNLTAGIAFTGLHGWAPTPPRVEYFVVDNYPPAFETWLPLMNRKRGQVETSFGTYDLWYRLRILNLPEDSIELFWAVRTTPRPEGGYIDTGEIFDAWAAQDMHVVSPHSLFVSIEGWEGSRGSAELAIVHSQA